MPLPPDIFAACTPRADVLAGNTRDEQFAADLSQVVRGTAPDEYRLPAVFFRNSHPTRGMRELLAAVCRRLSGSGGEVASVLRLDTQYGGGKTHGLIALVHAVRGMQGVEDVAEFVDPGLLPKGEVRVAALDGENSDPVNGLTLEGDLRAYSMWGELAYRLAGAEGYRRVEASDRQHVAPGAETIRELFGGRPTLVMIDEVSVYLRKVEQARPGAGDQFSAFLQALIKAIESSPGAALVFTLAVGKDAEAKDAYKAEHERALQILAEAEAVAGRKATLLNPTEEDETAAVLRRRLFASIDRDAAEQVVEAYARVWANAAKELPAHLDAAELKAIFRASYPLHPETLALLTEKTASLGNFQRIRGMVRLLARTVHVLWRDQPADALAVHPHHIDPGHPPIRSEFTSRLGLTEYTPALKADVAAVERDEPSVAQRLDQRHNPGGTPVTSYVARTIFLNSLAHADAARGLGAEHLRYSVGSPAIEPSFVEQARKRFVAESDHLDDRPGAPLRLLVEANLTQVVRKRMAEVDGDEVRAYLNAKVEDLFGKSGGKFELAPFPAGPYEVPDEVGSGRPFLVVMGYDALAIPRELAGLPPDVAAIFKHKGHDNKPREFRNNLVFVVADEGQRQNMKDRVRRLLALQELCKPERIRVLADHQQRQIKEDLARAPFEAAQAILHCYRHLFYPSHARMAGSDLDVAHAAIELPKSGNKPGEGEGQVVVGRVLRDQKKLLDDGDPPDAPGFVSGQTPLKTRGEITTGDLRNEFRRAPRLSILLSDGPLKAVIRQGIHQGLFVYRERDQVWGQGDPEPAIRIGDDAFVHTVDDARKKHLWPRPDPLSVRLSAAPSVIAPGSAATLTATVEGGVPPYAYHSDEPKLCLASTTQTAVSVSVAPEATAGYKVEVTDARGHSQSAAVEVRVDAAAPPDGKGTGTGTGTGIGGGNGVGRGIDTPRPPQPADAVSAEGPLAQALVELWEKARKAGMEAVGRLVIRFYDPAATWNVHGALATMAREAQIACRVEVLLEGDGFEAFRLEFEGRLEKAGNLRGVIDPFLRTADKVEFLAIYTLAFATGLPLVGERPEALAKSLTKYGGGEAFVEAHAAAQAQEVPS